MLSRIFSHLLVWYLSLIPLVHAFAWPRTTGKYVSTVIIPDVGERTDETFRTDSSLEDAVQLPGVTNGEPFGSYFHRPDCFQKAAKLIRKRCSDLHLDELERVNAAISMTLCEIATAKHHSLPLECTSFTTGYDPASTRDAQMQGRCVDALSRSAQFWSSYSGYLREIPQLCFAFQKSEDIDFARDIYRNSTLEQINFLHSLKDRENRIEGNLRRWENQLAELHFTAVDLQMAALNIEKIINEWEARSREHIVSTQLQVYNLVSEGSRQLYDAGVLISEQMDIKLSAVFLHYEVELQRHMSALEAQLFQVTESVFVQANQRIEELLLITAEVTSRWTDMSHEFMKFRQSLQEVSHSIFRAVVTLNESSHQSEVAYQQQLKSAAVTTNLIEAIGQLTEATKDQFKNINESAASIHQHLVANNLVSNHWLNEVFRAVLNSVIQVEPAALDSILRLPVLRLLLMLSYGVIFILRTAISGVLSLVVVIFVISRRYLQDTRIITFFAPTVEPSVYAAVRQENTKAPTLSPCTMDPSTRKQLTSRCHRLTCRRVSRIPERLCKVPDA